MSIHEHDDSCLSDVEDQHPRLTCGQPAPLLSLAEHQELAGAYALDLIRSTPDLDTYLRNNLAASEYTDGDLIAVTELLGLGDLEVTVRPAGPPRVWDLPPEPGPEVLAVRDRRARLWTRAPSGWACEPYSAVAWRSLIEYDRPLIDATGELAAPPATAEVTA